MKKKDPKFDLEGNRKVYFSLGLFIVSAVTTMAFTYKTPVYQFEKKQGIQEVDIPIMLVVKDVDEPEVTPPIPEVEPLSAEKQTTPIFSDQDLLNILRTKSTNKDPKLTLTTPEPIDSFIFIGTPEPVDPGPAPAVDFPDKEAEFIGSWTGFLGGEVNYPPESEMYGDQGNIHVRFIVETDGSVTDVRVLNKNTPKALQKEAIRVVKSSPKWKPGIKDGEYVRSTKTVVIKFKII